MVKIDDSIKNILVTGGENKWENIKLVHSFTEVVATETGKDKDYYFNQYFHINPDFINRELQFALNLSSWPIKVFQEDQAEYLYCSTFRGFLDVPLQDMVRVDSNSIYFNQDSANLLPCLSAAIAEFIRFKMLESDSSFSFESVFSHSSKVDFIAAAKDAGFKTYLYFIATEDPLVNMERVRSRVLLSSLQKRKIKGYTFMDNQLLSGLINLFSKI